MDRHDRFMKVPTEQTWQFLKDIGYDSDFSNNLYTDFYRVLRESYESPDSLEVLKAVHAIFCLFYQKSMSYLKNCYLSTKFYEATKFQFERLEIDKTLCLLHNQSKEAKCSDRMEMYLVLDILALRQVLFGDIHHTLYRLQTVQNSMHQHLVENNELMLFDVKLMESLIDGILLSEKHVFLVGRPDGDKVRTSYLRNVELLLKLETHKEYDLLTLILPKLIKVVIADDMLVKLWQMLFTLIREPAEIFSILHVTADVWFPMTSELLDPKTGLADQRVKKLLDQSMEERLWLLLLKELSSPIPQQRRRALKLAKRVVDFVEKLTIRMYDLQFCDNYQELRPLVYIGEYFDCDIFKEDRKNWFLVLEELDKDEEHVVTPVFELLKNMLKESSETHGFHIAWIRYAFARILQDSSIAVVKWGLLEVFTLDLELYNDEFLSLVLDALNNSFLYENDVSEEEPTVVKEFSILLNYAETNSTNLVTRFMAKASEMTWEPVPFFYFIHALSMVTKVECTWKAGLEAMKSLAETSLTIDCPMLRIASQIELLEAMTHFTTESLDLVVVAKTLSAFPTSGALIRGQLAWNRTSAWLSKLVGEDEAVSFLDKIFGQITSEDSQMDLSMKSISIMIMLLHDGHLLFNSESCPGLTTLRKLLDRLIDTNSGPHDNLELEKRSLELVHHLLDLACSKDHVLYKFISNYADAALQFTFRTLRHVSDEALLGNIDTYVRVTKNVFTAESLVLTVPEIFYHIGRFETESWNIIKDKQWSNNLQRYYGIKILHSCLKSTSVKLKNYKFIGPLRKTYKIPMAPPAHKQSACSSQNTDGNLNDKIASEYYKFVAQLFCDYLTDEPVGKWLSDINWIEEVSYLIQVGGNDIFTPLVGLLSRISFKGALKPTDIDNFKSAVRFCWMSMLESKEYWVTTEKLFDLIFSSQFLECMETRELTIECTRKMIDKGEKSPELRVIVLRELKRLKGESLSHFYDAVLTCLLHGPVPDGDEIIEQQACSYVLKRYQGVYPNYLSNMNAHADVAVRAHAVTLLHRMITNDPTRGAKLLPLIIGTLKETQIMQDLDRPSAEELNDSQLHRRMSRIFQVLLVLQPMLETKEIETLHTQLCMNIFLESSQGSVRLLQEWLLIRIYLDNESLRTKIWDSFDQGQEKQVDGICSMLSIVYHVARLLTTDLQLDFINAAFLHIMPCYMSHELNVRLNAQVVTSKLYDLASEKSYSTVTEKYRELYTALKKSLKPGNPTNSSIRLEHDFKFTDFDPINDYSLETLFYELPRLSKISSDEYIPVQLLEKFGFKEANSHPLKLLNFRKDVSEVAAMVPVLGSSKNVRQEESIPDEAITTTEDSLGKVTETLAPT